MEKEKPEKAPSFVAYTVREDKEGKAHFDRIGVAFPHADGKGHDLRMSAMPINGRITIRSPWERMDDLGGKQSQDRERKDRER